MDIEPARTMKDVVRELHEVEQKLLIAKEAYRKSGSDIDKGDWEDLREHKKSLLRQQELLLQHHTAPSSGMSPTDTHTTPCILLHFLKSSLPSLALRWAVDVQLAVLAVLCWLL